MKLDTKSDSDFDEFLKNEGIYDEVHNVATKRVIAYQLQEAMKAQKITKTKMANMMHTSRAVVDRLLSPTNESLTFKTLETAVNVLGKKVNISIV